MRGTILSIQVGRPETRGTPGAEDPHEREWTSAIVKEPVGAPIHLGRMNLDGDAQADLRYHGGLDKAVLCYPARHYDHWREAHPDTEWTAGGFGENFTVADMSEETVCVGDVFGIGPVMVQVSQPRQPCWKLGRRWRLPELVKEALDSGRCGWYLRVLREGFVKPGMQLTLLKRPNPQWTIVKTHRVMHFKKDDLRAAAQLAAVEELSASWRDSFRARFAPPNHTPPEE